MIDSPPRYIEHPGKQLIVIDVCGARLCIEHFDANGAAADATSVQITMKNGAHAGVIMGQAELDAIATALDKMTNGFLHENCDKHIEPEDMPDPADEMVSR